MINPEVRHIIEPELDKDEELLWADTVDDEQVRAFIRSKLLSDKLWFPIFCAVIFIFVKLVIDVFPLDVRNKTDLFVTVLGLIVIVSLIMLLTWCASRMRRSFKSNENYIHYKNLLGYGLSTQRVFYVNRTAPVMEAIEIDSPKVWKSFPRRDLRFRIISNSLLLDHTENYAGISTIEFKFLKNADKSAKALESLIGRKHHEQTHRPI